MNKSEGIRALFDLMREVIHHNENKNIINTLIKDVENDFSKHEFILNTTLAKHIQVRITQYMWKTLKTIPETSNLMFLFKHAFLSEMAHWIIWLDRPDSQDKKLALLILSGLKELHGCRRKRKTNVTEPTRHND
jgi:hypothetical protein